MFISVNYDDPDRAFETYKGFEVSDRGNSKSKKVFCTGDPPQDFRSAVDYAFERGEELGDPHCGMSSSVDHFVTDCGGRYGWYTDEYGRELFDRAEMVEELKGKAAAEVDRRLNTVAAFLSGVGVPEDIAKRDAPTILEALYECDPETVKAIINHSKS